MWGQYKKSISAWIQRISNKRIQELGRPTVITLHQPPTLESPILQTKKMFLQKLHRVGFPPIGTSS